MSDRLTKEEKLPLPPLWYDTRGKTYYAADASGRWIPIGDRQAKVSAKRTGYNPNVYDGLNVSETEQALWAVMTERNVSVACELAGWPAGPVECCGQRLLCTRGPAIIQPKRGKWETLQGMWVEQLSDPTLEDPERQWHAFNGWILAAYTALREGRRASPAPALCLAGARDCGKSFCQQILTAILGGRSANPLRYLTGKTAFNSDMLAAEHLAIEDTASSRDLRDREAFGQSLKECCVNHDQSLHGKGKDALTVQVFWRVSISLNDEPYALQVLPPLDDNMRDKLLLLRIRRPSCFPKTPDPEHWRTFKPAILAELPAYLYWLTHNYKVPAEYQDPRYGVAPWQHPELAASLEEMHPYQRLMSLIDLAAPWKDSEDGIWTGRVEELERALRSFDDSLTDKLFRNNSTGGLLLATCMQRHPERFSKRTLSGYTVWTIRKPVTQEIP